MEISIVRKRLTDTIDRAKRAAAQRRAAAESASQDYAQFLEQVAVPLFRQIASALKASGYPFGVNTPGGSVRMVSDRSAEDYLDLSLDTSGDEPHVLLRTSRTRGRRVFEEERPIGKGPISGISEELLLDVLLKELEPYVEK